MSENRYYISSTGSYYVGDRVPGDIEVTARPSLFHSYNRSTHSWEYDEVAHAASIVLTPWQFTKMLRELGIFTQVMNVINSFGEEATDGYTRAGEFKRDNPLLLAVQQQLEFSNSYVDKGFILGAQL